MDATATALNRFGLGARPGELTPGQPRRWLLDQLARYQPLPPAWSAQPRTGTLMADLMEQQRMVREAAPMQRPAARQLLQRHARDVYLAAVGARADAALQTPAPFPEHLVHFWSNHFAVSIDKGPVLGLAGAFEVDAIRPHVLGRF